MEGERRVFTIRTETLLINKTEFSYSVQLFHDLKLSPEVVDLAPGQSFALPDDPDPKVKDSTYLRIKQTTAATWSKHYKLEALKKKIKVGTKAAIVYGAGDLHNVLIQRELQDDGLLKDMKTGPEITNFVLLSPIIFQNCLPTSLMFRYGVDIKHDVDDESTY